jgi:DNA-binding SARP family transcriptional activator
MDAGDGGLMTIDSVMVRALLATLVLHANQFLSSDRLVAQLWDEPPTSHQANVRKYAALLRRALDRRSPGLSGRLEARRHRGYRLVAAAGEIDSERFTELTRQGRCDQHRGDSSAAASAFIRALSYWRGPAGHDLPPYSGIGRRVRALNEERLTVQTELVDARVALGETASVISGLRATVAAHPLHERSWEQLIRAMHAVGNTAAALATYGEARRIIRHSLGIEPSGRLRSLHHALLHGTAGAISP